MKYKVCLFANEDPFDHELWVTALKKSQQVQSFDIIHLMSDNWLQVLERESYDLFLFKPSGRIELFKRIYDERLFLISQFFTTPVYPSIKEMLIYENKRLLRDWLMINGIPHPETFVFFDKKEADSFVQTRKNFPMVGKTNIGASGNGIQILKDKSEILDYIEKAFSVGISPRTGPKLTKGPLIKKIKKGLFRKGFLKKRLKDYASSPLDKQLHYVILQEYIKHDFEWRCVRIGDSFFAHKKMVRDGKASGHLIKLYDPVPRELLDFIKDVTDKCGLTSVSIDLFEKNNHYLINEVQCFFGQSDPYQMLVDGKPGRYVADSGKWVFEEGMFNTNQCYDLRLAHAISLIENQSGN